jgi:hypothetical protein
MGRIGLEGGDLSIRLRRQRSSGYNQRCDREPFDIAGTLKPILTDYHLLPADLRCAAGGTEARAKGPGTGQSSGRNVCNNTTEVNGFAVCWSDRRLGIQSKSRETPVPGDPVKADSSHPCNLAVEKPDARRKAEHQAPLQSQTD